MDYFDALMSGNLARRRQTKFMPADFKLIEARQPPLKDSYDEWLARIICYAFSVPVSAFVSQVNRATGETLRQQAAQEGLIPLKAWVKNALDHVICVCMNEPSLEFVWVGDDAVDPLEQAQTLQILVGAGIKTREEARADLGLAPAGGSASGKPQAGLGKYNHNHDEQGRFSTADNAAGPVGKPTRKPRPTGVQVASNEAVMSDESGSARKPHPAPQRSIDTSPTSQPRQPITLQVAALDNFATDAIVDDKNKLNQPDTSSPIQVNDLSAYHDQVVNEEITQYENSGAKCASEVRLNLDNVDSVIDILCVTASGNIMGVEVKTGVDPYLSPSQAVVYSHAVLGAGVMTDDPKVDEIGIARGIPLPAFPIVSVWAPSPGEPKRFFLLRPEPAAK